MRNNGDLGGVGETELLECLLTLSPNWRSGGVNLFSIFSFQKFNFPTFSILFLILNWSVQKHRLKNEKVVIIMSLSISRFGFPMLLNSS